MKITALCGSLRKGSLNRQLMEVCCKELERLGAEVTRLDSKDVLQMPLYDGDDEASSGVPPKGQAFKELMGANKGLLIVSPEYNAGIPGGLKNAIDWASRPPVNPFKGKVVCLCGTSPGAFGAVRGHLALRQTLMQLQAWVSPTTVTLPRGHLAFDDQGGLKEEWARKEVSAVMATFHEALKGFGA